MGRKGIGEKMNENGVILYWFGLRDNNWLDIISTAMLCDNQFELKRN